MNREALIEKINAMMAAGSCCREAKEACQAALDALGTEKEAEALANLKAELEEDVCPIDGLIAFAGSDMGKQVFGEEHAKEMLQAATEAKEAGETVCICPACQAGAAILKEIG